MCLVGGTGATFPGACRKINHLSTSEAHKLFPPRPTSPTPLLRNLTSRLAVFSGFQCWGPSCHIKISMLLSGEVQRLRGQVPIIASVKGGFYEIHPKRSGSMCKPQQSDGGCGYGLLERKNLNRKHSAEHQLLHVHRKV